MATAKVTVPKVWDARYYDPDHPHTPGYYAKCIVGGALACGLTHAFVCPLDVVKCNMQVYPKEYTGLGQGLQKVMSEQGMLGLSKGWLPTLIGYSVQGSLKFGLYEFFKDFYSNLAGEENAAKYQGMLWLAGSASAEFFADIGLCPFEMIKVKVQTSPAGEFPIQFGAAFARMNSNRAETKFPFGSVPALWSRQIPYTMAKFYFFEKVVRAFYQYVFTRPKEEYTKEQQLAITFASGYIAGVVCAIVSHPADTLVSMKGKKQNANKSFGELAKEVGMKNLCTKGLGTRILMVGTLTGLQWWIYDTYKAFCGLPTAGGGKKKK